MYCSFLHFGAFNGLNRNIAFFSARSNSAKVQAQIDASWAVAKHLSSFGLALTFLLLIYFLATTRSHSYIACILFVGFALVLEPRTQHMEAVFLSSSSFHLLGRLLHYQNFLTFCANFLPFLLGLPGFIISRVVFFVTRFTTRHYNVPITPSDTGTISDARELAATGFPILCAGMLFNFTTSADRTLIALRLGPEDVGKHSLASLVFQVCLFLPTCVATVYYPKLAAAFGRTNDPGVLRPYFWRLLLINIAVLAPICSLSYLLISPLTRHFLPDYVDGIPAAQFSAVSSFALVSLGPATIFAVTRRNSAYILAILAALLTAWFLGNHWISEDYGILGATWAKAISIAAVSFFTLVFAYIASKPEPNQVAFHDTPKDGD
jgi:O-antigen/teichoic acid export membrane protein